MEWSGIDRNRIEWKGNQKQIIFSIYNINISPN